MYPLAKMGDQMEQKPEEQAYPIDTLRLLYPLFKEEVFRRRVHMMALSGVACTVLIAILIFFPLFPQSHLGDSPFRWMATTGIILYSSLLSYLILQHADRHRMAKRQLIRLEQEAGLYLPHRTPNPTDPLYPQNWQTDWMSDTSVRIYLTCISCLTVLVVSMFLMLG